MLVYNLYKIEWVSLIIYKYLIVIKCSYFLIVMLFRDRKKMCMYRISRLGEIIRFRLVII